MECKVFKEADSTASFRLDATLQSPKLVKKEDFECECMCWELLGGLREVWCRSGAEGMMCCILCAF